MAQKFKTAISILELGSASSQAIAASVSGDAASRISIDAGGKITWGSGSAAGDTTLYRSAADILKTDDAFEAASLSVSGAFTLPTVDGASGQVLSTDGEGNTSWTSTGAGGVTDHGALTGLSDDDHQQYPRLTASATAPSSPRDNDLWFHTEAGRIYVYYDSFWVEGARELASVGLDALGVGGVVSNDGTYVYHTFTSSSTFSLLNAGTLSVEYFVVAGGGGGGSNNGGGGGAGGVLNSTVSVSSTQTVSVGSGGAVDSNGGNSVFGAATATGGGAGGDYGDRPGANGGSGGGAGSTTIGVYAGGSGVAGQGYAGGSNYPASSAGRSSGGGGGAGGVGANGTNLKGGDGGAGIEWPSGSGNYYAGGGGGWVYSSDPSHIGLGGSGIGGNGGNYPSGSSPTTPTASTGSGGGGGISSLPATAGADGIVIVRYNPSTDWTPA